MGRGRVRLPDWQTRLTEAIREAQRIPFDARSHNCVLFAARCVEAITGAPVPRRWKGSLEPTVDALLPRVKPSMAARGDVVLADVPEPSLGVCIGRKAAFVSPTGLIFEPMRKARIAWSV